MCEIRSKDHIGVSVVCSNIAKFTISVVCLGDGARVGSVGGCGTKAWVVCGSGDVWVGGSVGLTVSNSRYSVVAS